MIYANNKTLTTVFLGIAALTLLSGCFKPMIVGGVDATELNSFDLPRSYTPPPEKITPIRRASSKSSIRLNSKDKEHVYIAKGSGAVSLDPSKIYHWVAEGEESAVPKGYQIISAQSIPVETAGDVLADSAEYGGDYEAEAGEIEPQEVAYESGAPIVMDTPEPHMQDGAETAANTIEAQAAHVHDGDMEEPMVVASVEPGAAAAGIVPMGTPPVNIAHQPEPVIEESRFDMDKIVDLVLMYESAMRARDPEVFTEIFAGQATFKFSMNDGALVDQYNRDEYIEVHRKAWSQKMDYDFRINDVSVAVSADGTTAVAEGFGTEIMKARGNRVTAKSRITFVIEEIDGSLLVTSLESEGDLKATVVER